MKLRNRINLYTSVLFIGLLIVINIIIYYSFNKITVDSVLEQNYADAERIVHGINESIGLVETDDLIRAYSPADGMIRIVLEEKTSPLTVTSSSEQTLSSMELNYYHEELIEHLEYEQQHYSFVTIPIIWTDGDIVNLQIIENLNETFINLNRLKIVLIFATLAAMIPVIISSSILSRLITTPITSLIETMTNIRKSGQFHRIQFKHSTKDELAEMSETFNHMIDILKTNSDKQEQFLSNASHELKTPLTVIESYASLLRRRGKTDSALFDESVEAIHSEAIRMREMTEQLLLLAKPYEHWTVELETIKLHEFAEQTVTSFQKAFGREVKYTVEAEMLIDTDQQKLKQLLYIFLDNARKYSEAPITVTIERVKEQACIIIFDQGIGIPKQDLPKVFDRFYRVDQARTRATGGTGLGLSLAKELADAIGAEIKLDSIEGFGTTIKIFLP